MDERPQRPDGFHVLTGALAVLVGTILLLRGAPAGWSSLLIADGIALLFVQWAIVNDLGFKIPDRMHFLAAAVGLVCIGIAFVYLTRAADDLPSLFPGHDGDSEQFRILPGAVALLVGAAVLGRTLILTQPKWKRH